MCINMPPKKKSVDKEKKKDTFGSRVKFADLDGVPKCALEALKNDFGYEYLSSAQALYMQSLLNGQDMLVRAGTGSGKTIGFLIPLLTTLINKGPKIISSSSKVPVVAVIISPARELAEQTLEQAKRLVSSCSSAKLSIQTLVGGVRSTSQDRNAMRDAASKKEMIVAVATPGRLLEHLEGTPGFKEGLESMGLVLVLDEVDRLLDPGFRPAVMKVSGVMKSPKRQTLLFTATASAEVQKLAKTLIKQDDAYVDAGTSVAQGSAGAAHNTNVKQEAVLVPPGQMVPVIHDEFVGEKAGLTVIFVPTAAMASTLTEVLRAYGDKGVSIFEIHSRLSQSQRSRAVADFKKAKPPAAIVATDVFARGLDVQGVTLVLQIGIAPDNAQVAHRVGRTGRGGAQGRALMVLSQSEERVLKELIEKEKMPITIRSTPKKELPAPPSVKKDSCKTFIATIGFYKAQMKRLGWKSNEIVSHVAAMFEPMGIKTPAACPVNAKLIKKMGLPADHGLTVK